MSHILKPDVSFAEIAGKFPRNNTKRAYLHRAADYKIVETRPDGAILIKDSTISEEKPYGGFAWLIGDAHVLPNFKTTRQCFCDGYIPIHTITYELDSILYTQTSFTTKAGAIPCVAIRLTVKNEHIAAKRVVRLAASAINCALTDIYEHDNEDYLPFVSDCTRWLQGENFVAKDNGLYFEENIAAVFLTDLTGQLKDGLFCFTKELQPGESMQIITYIPYEWIPYRSTPPEKIASRTDNFVKDADIFLEVDFDNLLEDAVCYWENLYACATKIDIPEEPITQIYKTLTLNSLQFISFPPESQFPVCGQGGYNNFAILYGWEAQSLLSALDIIGYHEYVEKVIDYYLSIQGRQGPEGNIKSKKGTFRPHIFWMSETGAIMGTIAWHYFVTKDKKWMNKVADALIDACEWVRSEREATKIFEDGQPIPHYGLLPAGRVHDWPDFGYFYFSDVNTYNGYYLSATALCDAGFSEGEQYLIDAKEYLDCIKTAYAKSVYLHPKDPDLKYFSNEVYRDASNLMTSYSVDGPVCMLANEIFTPEDPIVDEFWASLKALNMIEDYFCMRMHEMEAEWFQRKFIELAGIDYRMYYTTSGDSVWYDVMLKRGDIGRALGIYYNTLAYATTRDLYMSCERYSPDMEMFQPWQPNASGNGRIIKMINNSLFYEENDTLRLMEGANKAWFEPGKCITVRSGRTLSYAFDFTMSSDLRGNFKDLAIKFHGDKVASTITLPLYSNECQFECSGNIKIAVENGKAVMTIIEPGEKEISVRILNS